MGRGLGVGEHLPVHGVGVGVGVAVGVGDAVGVGVDVGVGVPDGTYVIARTGGLVLSRVSNRLAVGDDTSSPNTSQPKLLAGLSNHPCTSATIWAELHVY